LYKLFYAPGAASLAVHWMLVELGVEFELSRVDFQKDEQKTPEFRNLNPKGQVPVLVIDGQPHSESAALLMLLAERHPSGGLAPPPGSRARPAYVEAMFVLANGLLPAFRAWFYAGDVASPDHEEETRNQARRRIEASFERLDEALSDGRQFLVGDTMSAVDFLATMLVRWSRNMPKPAETWPRIKEYSTRMKTRPALRDVHRREGLTDWI
jgi:glutathione S-transferase